MKKINITMMIFLSAICMVVGLNDVKAKVYTEFGTYPDLPSQSEYYMIAKHKSDSSKQYLYLGKNDNNCVYSNFKSYLDNAMSVGIENISGSNCGYDFYQLENNSWTYKKTVNVNSQFWGASGSYTDYNIATTIPFKLRNNSVYVQGGTGILESPISISSNNSDGLTTFTINFSQFEFDQGYKFLYGFHDLAMIDVTNDLINGIYSSIIDFDDDVIARVVDSNGNIIAESTHHMSYGLKDQLVIYFHNNVGDDFITYTFNNVDLDNDSLTNNPQIRDILYSGSSGRVAIDFYKESTFETLWNFDGTFCLSRDIDVYIKWSGLIPEYTTNIYAKDEKIWFNINFTRWDSESSDIVIFATETTEISNATSLMNRTYTYGQYTNHTIQDESVFSESVIELKFGYIVDNRPKIFLIRTISVNNLINNLPQATQEEVRLVDEYHKTQLGLDSDNVGFINKFINSIQVPIQAITDLTSYMFGKCNIYIKSFLISIFTIIIVAAIIKFIK